WRQGLEREPRGRQGDERHLVPDDRVGDRARSPAGGRGLPEGYALHRPRRLGPAGSIPPASVRSRERVRRGVALHLTGGAPADPLRTPNQSAAVKGTRPPDCKEAMLQFRKFEI